MISFTVPGQPIPQPRHRFRTVRSGGRWVPQAYLPPKHPVHAWKSRVVAEFLKQDRGNPGVFPLCGGVCVDLTIVNTRPQTCTRKTGTNPRLWDDRRGGPHSGDVDNFAKSILDALTGRAWDDDGQIVELIVRKYAAAGDEQPHAAVLIRRPVHAPQPYEKQLTLDVVTKNPAAPF